MTKEELRERLLFLRGLDPEGAHIEADKALIEYIDDPEIAKAYGEVKKWYS